MHSELASLIGADHVCAGATVADMTGLSGVASALVSPGNVDEVAAVVAWCYERDVAIVPVGGRSGLAAGCVPIGEAVCVDMTRMDGIRSFDPLLWRMEAEAGVRTATIARRARENGLFFGPDPGAAEQSTLGGNIACNAGGPHAFKYGSTGAWITGIEAVIASGEVVRFGGPVRKDVAGYDMRALLIGSEGTLGIVTSAWLKLLPAPAERTVLAASFATSAGGVDALENVLASGAVPATIEFLDGATLRVAGAGFPGDLAPDTELLLICEAETRADAEAIASALGAGVLRPDPEALWRWRDGVSLLVTAAYGAKTSEDIAVPLDRFGEAIEATAEIGRRAGVATCCWGHAGDGNLHATFMHEVGTPPSDEVVQELLDLAIALGGTISGEHGLGLLKSGRGSAQWEPAAIAAQQAVKNALDPKGLFNPGKKQLT